ncbi:MAG: Ig-like domain-containing protein, partial [Verrucomicrobia bacterium]|nr:Ig-like domain-containing protein [Verrucomicrobiota bacterium]
NVGTNAVGDDIWHHVTLIYGHVPYSIGIVYVDGKLDSDGVWDLPGSWPTFRNLMIGRSWDGWWKRFNGYMDDVYMFNRMLNATEVAQVMTGNLPPLVSVTNPVNNATILQGAAIVLGASASDIEGTVTNVAFYADGALLGSDTTAPYSYTWTTAALGAHTLAAVAWDNTGLSSTSAVVNITVTVPPPYRSYTSAPITENFDGLGPNGTSLSLLVGWNAGHFSPSIQQGTSGGNGVATVTDPLVVDNGSHDTGGTPMLANFGTTGSADRALGSFARTTPAGDQFLQLAIKNDSGNPIGSFTLSYKGEEWRSANAAAQDLTMWYSNTDATNGFVSMGSGFTFNSPNNSGSNVALDGNASGNYTLISGTYTPASPIAAGSIFYLRWYDINNNGIADDFFAIDDVVVTPAAPVPPKPVISGITGPVAGQFTIQGTTAAAATLVTEMATNLAAPIFWVKIQTNAVPGGAYSITFPQGTGPSAYYRVLSQ